MPTATLIARKCRSRRASEGLLHNPARRRARPRFQFDDLWLGRSQWFPDCTFNYYPCQVVNVDLRSAFGFLHDFSLPQKRHWKIGFSKFRNCHFPKPFSYPCCKGNSGKMSRFPEGAFFLCGKPNFEAFSAGPAGLGLERHDPAVGRCRAAIRRISFHRTAMLESVR